MSPVRVVRSSPSEAMIDFDALFQEQFDYVWFTLRRLGIEAATSRM